MKATNRDFIGGAPRAARGCTLFFLCGPDEAGAAAGAEKIIAALPEPGERIELTGAEIKADPARLADESRSASLFGGSRHLLVRAAGDEAYQAVASLFELADAGAADGACPIIIVATGATDKARTAKIVAGRKDALMAMFWPPDLATISTELRQMADAAGLRLDAGLAERIARGAGMDIRLAGSEIEKLALYLDAAPDAPRPVTSDDLAAIGAMGEEEGTAPLIDAVLGGRLDQIRGELARMGTVGLDPVVVALALERRAALLARLQARLAGGGSVKAASDAERVYFGERKSVERQLAAWSAPRIERLVGHLARLHRLLMTRSAMADLHLADALVRIARAAGRAPT